jgi:hypothetical protein
MMAVESWEDDTRRSYTYAHNPRAGACPALGFRRCPCCGCDVLDDLDGNGQRRGDCCSLCHPDGDCPDC